MTEDKPGIYYEDPKRTIFNLGSAGDTRGMGIKDILEIVQKTIEIDEPKLEPPIVQCTIPGDLSQLEFDAIMIDIAQSDIVKSDFNMQSAQEELEKQLRITVSRYSSSGTNFEKQPLLGGPLSELNLEKNGYKMIGIVQNYIDTEQFCRSVVRMTNLLYHQLDNETIRDLKICHHYTQAMRHEIKTLDKQLPKKDLQQKIYEITAMAELTSEHSIWVKTKRLDL